MNLSKQYAVLTVSAATLLLAFNVAAQDYSVVPVLTQHAKKALPDKTPQEIETVIRQFWDGLGRLDADTMKQSMDWPVTIIEGSMTNSKQAIVLRNPMEFDEEFKRTPASAIEKGRSEFFGTKLLAFKVKMLSPNLASVTYSYRLPHDLVARDPKSKGGIQRRDRAASRSARREPLEDCLHHSPGLISFASLVALREIVLSPKKVPAEAQSSQRKLSDSPSRCQPH